jgi:hypothetical protein
MEEMLVRRYAEQSLALVAGLLSPFSEQMYPINNESPRFALSVE